MAEEMTEETRGEEAAEERLGAKAEMETLGPCKLRARVAVPAEAVRREVDDAYRTLAKSVQLPGFRPGRVPRRLLEARFGKEIDKELKDSLVQASFGEIVEENSLAVVGEPKFDNVRFEKEEDLTYEVELEVRPEFELPEYRGVEVSREPEPVSDADVEAQLRNIQLSQAQLVPIDPRQAAAEDVYRGKYALYRDGLRLTALREVEFAPASGRMDVFSVPDLAERIAGWDAESGAPLAFEVEVPSDFRDEVLRGQKVELRFTFDEVLRREPPALDDEFAKSLGEENLENLRREVRASLEYRARLREDSRVEQRIVEKLAGSVAMDLPEGFLAGERERWRERRKFELLLGGGIDPTEVERVLDSEGEAAEEDLRRSLKAKFLLDRIAEKEGIEADEDEVYERVEVLARHHGVPSRALREELAEKGGLERIREMVRDEKVRAFLRENAKIAPPAEGASAPSPEGAAAHAPEDAPTPAPEAAGEAREQAQDP